MPLRTAALLCLCAWAVRSAESPSDAPPGARLLCALDVEDFGAETLRIGDLDCDGAPDFLFVQSIFETREITCLTATDVMGRAIWQQGKPDAGNGRVYSDLPIQVYDWDRDGRNEVLYVRQARYVDPPFQKGVPRERAARYEGQATFVILDGRTGGEKSSFAIPAPADDSFLFADLTGRGRQEDLVVKDRYWSMWGVSHEGKVLWQWSGSPGHFPSVADVDGDGRDEVFVGYALLDHDGKALFSKGPAGAHQDACFLVRPADGRWRLLFGNTGLHCLDAAGNELWKAPHGECQHVLAGRFRADSPLQILAIDRTPEPTHRRDGNAWAILYLYDLDGKELWSRKQPKGAWAIAPVPMNWSGCGAPLSVLIYGMGPGAPAVVYDGEGRVTETLPLALTPERNAADAKADFYGLAADVWGDERDEVIFFGSRGACVYVNTRAAQSPTRYNETFYPGM